ncbi:hypothetical protein K9N68_11875 [Kovacikia minuta CCNUW1]|uniref:hypothetical protein n=1 Tax=Kovacikia minuta TaxID=2931930 RepID=UPI001CCECE3C|nr:hypothetical protein [Kovacikia minuta]UBF28506.1 hypothetical protein K9N68_11875 [Kovacikia minuta CCNUW1]
MTFPGLIDEKHQQWEGKTQQKQDNDEGRILSFKFRINEQSAVNNEQRTMNE